MARIFFSYADPDRATAEVLGRLLHEAGLSTFWDWNFPPGTDFAWALEAEQRKSDVSLVLWSRHSALSPTVRADVNRAAREGKLLLVRVDDSALPTGVGDPRMFDLREWQGRYSDALLIERLRSTVLAWYARGTSNLEDDPFASLELGSVPAAGLPESRPNLDLEALSLPSALPDSMPDIELPMSSPSDPFADLAYPSADPVFAPGPPPMVWKRELPPQAARPPEDAQPQPSLRPPESPAGLPKSSPGILGSILKRLRLWWPRKQPEPVLLSASAPRESEPGTSFTAVLVAYVASSRASAHQKLANLGEPSDRRVDDVSATAWVPGAPIRVRLSAEGASVFPSEVRFVWSGTENLAAFNVKAAARRGCVESTLCFEVFVAEVLVAFIPMQVKLRSGQATSAPNRVQAVVPKSAFASYSSKDAEPVTQRLSTLSRWSPGLDIFQDCLDLKPGEHFKPQLAKQIAGRDVFLLFWSRSAAMSPWVKWEYTTAIDQKGLSAILPMPLEDPAIAPPPPELAKQHQRDRYMLAGYGLARIRHEAARGRP